MWASCARDLVKTWIPKPMIVITGSGIFFVAEARRIDRKRTVSKAIVVGRQKTLSDSRNSITGLRYPLLCFRVVTDGPQGEERGPLDDLPLGSITSLPSMTYILAIRTEAIGVAWIGASGKARAETRSASVPYFSREQLTVEGERLII